MTESATAKLFKHGRSQAVRLPKEFRLPGKEVQVHRHRHGRGVLLAPMDCTPEEIQATFAEIDRLTGRAFLPEGRAPQPPMPAPRKVFDE
jgi:antitoxin VapB